MANAKKIAVYAGVGAIWVAGFIVCWKVGDLTGKITGKGCMKATEKLLELI